MKLRISTSRLQVRVDHSELDILKAGNQIMETFPLIGDVKVLISEDDAMSFTGNTLLIPRSIFSAFVSSLPRRDGLSFHFEGFEIAFEVDVRKVRP